MQSECKIIPYVSKPGCVLVRFKIQIFDKRKSFNASFPFKPTILYLNYHYPLNYGPGKYCSEPCYCPQHSIIFYAASFSNTIDVEIMVPLMSSRE